LFPHSPLPEKQKMIFEIILVGPNLKVKIPEFQKTGRPDAQKLLSTDYAINQI